MTSIIILIVLSALCFLGGRIVSRVYEVHEDATAIVMGIGLCVLSILLLLAVLSPLNDRTQSGISASRDELAG